MFRIPTVGAFLLAFCTTLFADELALRNGDRYSGELLKLADGVVSFKTDYGELKVKLGDVATLKMDKPLDVKVGEKTQSLAVTTDANGAFSFGETTVSLDDVASIAPPPKEPVRLSEWERWSGNVAAAIVWVDGNTHTVDYHGEINLVRDQSQKTEDFRNRLTLHGAYDYGYSNVNLTKRQGLGSFKWECFFSVSVGFYIEGRWRYDYLAGIERKNTLGLGLTAKLVDEEDIKITVALGASYLGTFYNEKVINQAIAAGTPIDPIEEVPAGRAMIDIKWKTPFGFDFEHNSTAYKSLSDTSTWEIENLTSFSSKLGGGLYFKLSVATSYVEPPAFGKQRTDVTYKLSIVFKF